MFCIKEVILLKNKLNNILLNHYDKNVTKLSKLGAFSFKNCSNNLIFKGCLKIKEIKNVIYKSITEIFFPKK